MSSRNAAGARSYRSIARLSRKRCSRASSSGTSEERSPAPTRGREARLKRQRRGTLFLDEIGELPIPMQAKLLRFLENRRYMRVGGTTKIEADVRLMFATLRPLSRR